MAEHWNSERFERSELIPMLPAQDRVCEVCFQWSDFGSQCYGCKHNLDTLVSSRPSVLPISLAVKGRHLANALWRYKNHDAPEQRDTASRQLAWLTQHFLTRHEGCLAAKAGVEKFDAVTWIPSSRQRQGPHPLRSLLESLPWASERLVEGLRSSGGKFNEHQPDQARFLSNPVLAHRNVLLVDDTWTRGANAMSAALSVQTRRPQSVAIVVIGRHFVPGYRDCATYSDHAESLGFDFASCAYCDDRELSLMQ